MATQVPNNPFDTQPPAPTNTSTSSTPTTPSSPTPAATTSGGTTQNMNTGIVNSAVSKAAALPDLKPQTYTAQTREVNAPTETVAGQVDSILAKDSPLMQRARTLATQQMSQRGLVNSSMAQGAGVAAMTDRALPIAQQDADTFNRRSLANMDATNQAGQFNVNQQNQLFAQNLGAATQNEFNERMAKLQESGQDFRQARDLASREAIFKLEQQGITNRFDQELALKSEMFNVEQLNTDRRMIQQNEADLKKIGLQLNAQRQDIPTTFAANISNTTMNGVNAILADGNLNADAKKAAIDNLVKYANSQIEWASKFYGTQIPTLSAPA